MTGRRFHRRMEMIPALPGSLQALLFSPLLNKAHNKGTQRVSPGNRVTHRQEHSQFLRKYNSCKFSVIFAYFSGLSGQDGSPAPTAMPQMGCNKMGRNTQSNKSRQKSTKRSFSQQSPVGGFTSTATRNQHLWNPRLSPILLHPFYGFLTRK